jgi:hypothetical protein
MLEALVALAGPDTTGMLVSDHGFHSDHLRPRGIPKEPAGPAVQHRPFGIFCLKGGGDKPYIKQDERIYGATLLDVTPTILTLFGLPVGEDMDGRVLVQAFEHPPEIERIPSWEKKPGECGMHPDDLRMDPAAAQAVLQQFVVLGYIQPNESQTKAVETAMRESKYNLARVYLDSHRPKEALPLLEEVAKDQPDEVRFAQHLAQCYLTLGRRAEAKIMLEHLVTYEPKPLEADKAKAEGEKIGAELRAAPDSAAAAQAGEQAAEPEAHSCAT